MPRAVTYVRRMRRLLAVVADTWTRLWFQERSTLPLELSRIGIGAALLVNYSLATPYLFDFWGESAWIPNATISNYVNYPWMQSIFYCLTSPLKSSIFHVILLFSSAAFMFGWRTSWVKWIVFVGEVSYDQRNIVLVYGANQILCSLLFILCLAPIGRALSLDRVREVREAKHKDLDAELLPNYSVWAGACIRLMQIQMATVFFYSATEKLRGNDWRNGDAIWLVFSNIDYYNRFLLDLFASHYWLVNVATYGTILVEIAFPILIWQSATRPYLLAAAIFLHIQIGLFMGLLYFSFIMIMGHMSFVREEWLARLIAAWKQTIGGKSDNRQASDGDDHSGKEPTDPNIS
jgi:hypothetical protein